MPQPGAFGGNGGSDGGEWKSSSVQAAPSKQVTGADPAVLESPSSMTEVVRPYAPSVHVVHTKGAYVAPASEEWLNEPHHPLDDGLLAWSDLKGVV